MTDEAANIVPFGKYRGQPVEAMMADQSYCAWALAQPSLRTRFAGLFTVIINGGAAPDAPTPEHNRMQLLFRNADMRVATYRAIVGKEALDEWSKNQLRKDNSVVAVADAAARMITDEETSKGTFVEPDFVNAKQWDAVRQAQQAAKDRAKAAAVAAAERRLKELLEKGDGARMADETLRNQPVEFEVHGWDVVINGPGWLESIAIELKPIMGDDYPVVLRTMKMRRNDHGFRRALIVDAFDADGATLDDLKWLFSRSGIAVRTLAEIRAALPTYNYKTYMAVVEHGTPPTKAFP